MANAYADTVKQAIDSFAVSGIKLAGMIVCPLFANEGLPMLLLGYLDKAIGHVREAGGLYIADEVQSGFGRTGRMWGYPVHQVVPDIVTLGKPMGNGHPISAVVAGRELMTKFRAALRYFNTYGGNPVSCGVAMAVLDVIEEENLVRNADRVGTYVMRGFRKLRDKHELIGDVRGRGLFLTVELVSDRSNKTPAPAQASVIVNSLRHQGILMNRIGEHDNVLKLRPPLVFSESNADQLMNTLDEVLGGL